LNCFSIKPLGKNTRAWPTQMMFWFVKISTNKMPESRQKKTNRRLSLTALKSQKLLQRGMHKILIFMKNLIFTLAFMLIGSFAFASNQPCKELKNTSNEYVGNPLKISIDLGDLSNLSEIELVKLIDNLPSVTINSDVFAECTMSYSVTFSFLGQSLTVTASGTAATCKEASAIARNGIKAEIAKAKELAMETFTGGN
jgi:hypothetical protein